MTENVREKAKSRSQKRNMPVNHETDNWDTKLLSATGISRCIAINPLNPFCSLRAIKLQNLNSRELESSNAAHRRHKQPWIDGKFFDLLWSRLDSSGGDAYLADTGALALTGIECQHMAFDAG